MEHYSESLLTASVLRGAELRAESFPLHFPVVGDFSTVKIDDINFSVPVCRDSNSTTYKGFIKMNAVTVKVIDYPYEDEEKLCTILDISGLQTLTHTNLAKCIGLGLCHFESTLKIILVLDTPLPVSLRTLLEENYHLKWESKLRIVRDIANVLSYLHGKKLMHRHLVTNDFLIDGNGNAVLHSLRYFCHRNTWNTRCRGSLCSDISACLSPEVLSQAGDEQASKAYDLHSDIFSFGLILCEVVTGRAPDSDFLVRHASNGFALDETELLYAILPECPEGLEALCYQCCETNPLKRPTAAQCVEEIDLILSELDLDLPSVSSLDHSHQQQQQQQLAVHHIWEPGLTQPLSTCPAPVVATQVDDFFAREAAVPAVKPWSVNPFDQFLAAQPSPQLNHSNNDSSISSSHSSDKHKLIPSAEHAAAHRHSSHYLAVSPDPPIEDVAHRLQDGATDSPSSAETLQSLSAYAVVLDRLQNIEHSMHDNVVALQQLQQPHLTPHTAPVAADSVLAPVAPPQAESSLLLTQYVSTVGDIHSKIGSMQHQIDEIRLCIQNLLQLNTRPATTPDSASVASSSVVSEEKTIGPFKSEAEATPAVRRSSATGPSTEALAAEVPVHEEVAAVDKAPLKEDQQVVKNATEASGDKAWPISQPSSPEPILQLTPTPVLEATNAGAIVHDHALFPQQLRMEQRETAELVGNADNSRMHPHLAHNSGERLLHEPMLSARHRSPTLKKVLHSHTPLHRGSSVRDSLYARSHLHLSESLDRVSALTQSLDMFRSPSAMNASASSLSASSLRSNDLRAKIDKFSRHVAALSYDSYDSAEQQFPLEDKGTDVSVPAAVDIDMVYGRRNRTPLRKRSSSKGQLTDALGSFLRVTSKFDDGDQRMSVSQLHTPSSSSLDGRRRASSPSRRDVVSPSLLAIPLRSSSRSRSAGRGVLRAESEDEGGSSEVKRRRRRGEPLPLSELYKDRPRMQFIPSAPASPYEPRVMYTHPTDSERGVTSAPRSPTYLPRSRSTSPTSRARLNGSSATRAVSPSFSSPSKRMAAERGMVSKEPLSTRKNATVYSFPSDSKPRLGFDMHEGTVYRRMY